MSDKCYDCKNKIKCRSSGKPGGYIHWLPSGKKILLCVYCHINFKYDKPKPPQVI